MSVSKRRWAWFLLACFVTAALLWTHRYQYAACDTDGCVVINRWTGSVTFRFTEPLPEEEPQGAVVVRGLHPPR